MPTAHTSITTVNTIVWPAAAWRPEVLSFTPPRNSPSWTSPLKAARTAPMMIDHGRSPGASGVSVARMAAFRCSEPLTARPVSAATAGCGGFVRRHRLRLRWPNADLLGGSGPRDRRTQLARGPLGVVRLGQRADDRDPLAAGGPDRAGVAGLDPSDRKDRDSRVTGGVAHQLEPDRGPSRLGRG